MKDLKKLKKKYGKVLKFTSEEEEVAYCKSPSFNTYVTYRETYKEDAYKAIINLFKDCVIGTNTYEDSFMLSSGNALVTTINKAKEFSIDATPQKDEFKKSAALIRHAFNVDPYQLTIEEFYKLLEEALWLQKHQDRRLENVYLTAFSKAFSN